MYQIRQKWFTDANNKNGKSAGKESSWCCLQTWINTYYWYLLTLALGPLPVSLVNVDVSGEAEVWHFTHFVQREQHIAGCQVAVYQL